MSNRRKWHRVDGGFAGLAAALAEPEIEARRQTEEERLADLAAERERRQARAQSRSEQRRGGWTG